MLKKIRINFLISSIIFFGVFSVYILTLAPTITAEDSGELVTAAYTLGIAHPPGYPLYVILGKLFTLIPLGSIAWRVNLMSAFFGALTASMVYLSIDKIVRNKILAVPGSLMLAFSFTFWSQSVIAEVYTLNTFLVTLSILFLLNWRESNKDLYLYLFSFFYGLTLTNHTASLLLAPAFAAFLIITDKNILKRWKVILKMFILFVVALTIYFYIPLRAFQQATLNWGPIQNWSDVWDHISRAQYNDFSPLTNSYSKTGVALSFFIELYKQFLLPSLFLAAVGLASLWKNNKALFTLTLGVFLLGSFGIIYLRKFGWNLGIDYTYRVYYLPTYIIFIFWLSIAFDYLLKFIGNLIKDRSSQFLKNLRTVFYIMIISLPLSFLYMNYEANDQSDYWLVYDHSRNLLESLDENSIYYFAYDGSLQGDTELFALLYMKKVEGLRPDIDVISEQQFFYKDVQLGLPKEYFSLSFEPRRKEIFKLLQSVDQRPIFTNFAVTTDYGDFGFFSLSNGYVFKLYENIDSAVNDLTLHDVKGVRGIDEIDEFSDYGNQGIVAHYYYNLAHYYLTQGYFDKSQEILIKAFTIDTAPFNHEYSRFLKYRKDWFDFRDTNS